MNNLTGAVSETRGPCSVLSHVCGLWQPGGCCLQVGIPSEPSREVPLEAAYVSPCQSHLPPPVLPVQSVRATVPVSLSGQRDVVHGSHLLGWNRPGA